MDGLIIALNILTVIMCSIVIFLLLKRKGGNNAHVEPFVEVSQGLADALREHIDRNRVEEEKYIHSLFNMSTGNIREALQDVAKADRDGFHNLSEQVISQMKEMRETLYNSIKDMKQDSEKKLNDIKTIVDKTLADTLEERLARSYKIINDRLQEVTKGLGDMQQLSSGVTDLKKVLSNVKSRGVWGEIMLGNLLEQMLTTEQFKSQVAIKGSDAVDFAVILPGKGEESIYLPIDSKFPDTSYQRILDAADDPAEYESAAKALINDIKKEAKSISEKYIKPPLTTDFAIMYLPTEGLFSEAVKREGLMSEIQSRYRIMLAGPTTLSALLSSLQMGFKTLALQKRSMEIRDLLIAFKHEFTKFAQNLEETEKRLGLVSKSIESASKRTKIISKKLSAVESIADIEEEELVMLPAEEE